jgi:hypothetical protein
VGKGCFLPEDTTLKHKVLLEAALDLLKRLGNSKKTDADQLLHGLALIKELYSTDLENFIEKSLKAKQKQDFILLACSLKA